MRYPEDKIKEAILHPDVEMRDRAITYFGKSHSSDPTIMPLVIKAVETYGRDDAYHIIGASRDVRQTEETINWVIRELNDPHADQYGNYTYNLTMVLEKADVDLLAPRETEILQARHFFHKEGADFVERLRMRSWDELTCWQKLEEFCEENKDEHYISEVNLPYARRIVEALGRFGPACGERVHAILAHEKDDYSQGTMLGWLGPLAVRLAGEVHLESAIPQIVAKLGQDIDDLFNEECSVALTRIGTPAVLHAVAEAFPTANWAFRLFASGEPLENIHSDLAVQTCLDLFNQEQDEEIRDHLAQAVLIHFAREAIELARGRLIGRPLYFGNIDVMLLLLETATITGWRFPEYDQWMAEQKAENEERRRRLKELESSLSGKKKPADPPKPKPRPAPVPSLGPPRKPLAKEKIGRNDRCRCGSGRKFKNCCMRLQEGF